MNWTKKDSGTASALARDSRWESLAVLVAIRLWATTALSRQCFLEIRSDNTGALEMLSSFRSAAGGGLIVREIALDLAEGLFEPMQTYLVSVMTCPMRSVGWRSRGLVKPSLPWSRWFPGGFRPRAAMDTTARSGRRERLMAWDGRSEADKRRR